MNTPNMTHVVLPNLRWRGFQGGSTYMEALLPRVTTLLQKLQIYFLNEFSVSIPNLQQFISSAENLRFTSASLEFGKMGFALQAYPHEVSRNYALSVEVYRLAHNWPLYLPPRRYSALSDQYSLWWCVSLLALATGIICSGRHFQATI